MTTTIIRSHKIRLVPTIEQEQHFIQACGVSRFAYNWGLAEWRRKYQSGEKPTAYKLDKMLNAIKRQEFPWMYEVSKWATQIAIQNLGQAFRNFFNTKLRSAFPRFKKKGKCNDSFVPTVGVFCKIEGRKVWVPNLGWVKMRQKLRFAGKLLRVTISRVANQWYAAISVEMPWSTPERENQADGGLDVGISPLAVESDGTRWENLRPLQAELRKLRRWQRRLARRTKGSRGHREATSKIARIHKRVADIRNDSHHKLSHSVVHKYSRLGVESLNVSGMLKNRRLSRHISDASLGGLLDKVRYKAEWYGTELFEADRFFPSSKTCSVCGKVNSALKMEKRWRCECGIMHDRDLNAAINLKNLCTVGGTGTNASGQ